ncbi:MAG: ABC transporter substrate-binding protein [Desulfovibrionaceae bacterium]|nr:ABC transporter substrate-binding protein [Desulfovibrionaceae bacterium]
MTQKSDFSLSRNPFERGYQNQNLRIARTLLITCGDDCPPIWRSLHASQSLLPSDQAAGFPCLFGKDFALITEGQDVPAKLARQCPSEGIACAALYSVEAEDTEGRPAHMGDFQSVEAAREAIRQLSFETGFYSRCWEISSAHLTEQAWNWLERQADKRTPSSFLFLPFRIPCSPAIGLKLISTPWTDEVLSATEGIDGAWRLHEEHRRAGMPECLVEALRLAALADVRILVFDGDAPTLKGLPLYADE